MRKAILIVLAILLPTTTGQAPAHVALLVDGEPAALSLDASSPDALARLVRHAATRTDSFVAFQSASAYPGFATLEPMGDATGDALADVLLIHLPVEEADGASDTYAFRGVSPPGDTLWLTEFTANYVEWLTGVDLDGDGLGDAMVITLTAAGGGQPDASQPLLFPPSLVQWEWRLVALRGASGEQMWERVETGVGLVSPDLLVAKGNYFIAVVGGDADGDGGADVWLNVLDDAFAAQTFARADRVEVLSGATGAAIHVLALPTRAGALALPLGDVTGDGLADTVASTQPTADTTLLGVLAAGLPVWVGHLPYLGLAFPLLDLTGDAANDVVVAGNDDSFAFFDGTDGAALWRIEDPPFLGVVPGNIDGQAGNDIIFVDAEFAPALNAIEAITLAVAGDTGDVLYDTRPFAMPVPADGFASVELRLLGGDLDGDGVQEIIFNAENGPFIGRDRGEVHTVNGATGAIHWSRLGVDHSGRAIGDVTGDGRADILDWEAPLDQSSWTRSVLDGPTGAPLWTQGATGVDGVSAWAIGDSGGNAAGDLAFITIAAAESRLDVVDGSQGALLWDAP